MLVAELGSIFEVLKVHIVFGDKLEGAGCCGCFAGVLFAHALHGVDVAEGACVAEIAVEASAIHLSEEVLALLVYHGYGQLLVERGVTSQTSACNLYSKWRTRHTQSERQHDPAFATPCRLE